MDVCSSWTILHKNISFQYFIIWDLPSTHLYCSAISDANIQINQSLKLNPITNNCQFGLCSCFYFCVLDRAHLWQLLMLLFAARHLSTVASDQKSTEDIRSTNCVQICVLHIVSKYNQLFTYIASCAETTKHFASPIYLNRFLYSRRNQESPCGSAIHVTHRLFCDAQMSNLRRRKRLHLYHSSTQLCVTFLKWN